MSRGCPRRRFVNILIEDWSIGLWPVGEMAWQLCKCCSSVLAASVVFLCFVGYLPLELLHVWAQGRVAIYTKWRHMTNQPCLDANELLSAIWPRRDRSTKVKLTSAEGAQVRNATLALSVSSFRVLSLPRRDNRSIRARLGQLSREFRSFL